MLLAVAGGGGLLVEAVGVHTGVPFGAYAYTGDLGAEVLGVPVVVPLAWTMMAWPALVVGRTLARRPVAVDRAVRRRPVGGHDLTGLSRSRTALVGGVALAAWDLFLDPQMVDAGHWTWAHPDPGLPLVPGVPLTNYAGWLVVSVVMVGVLDRLLPRHSGPSGPAAALYLWTYGSSVLAHVVFFGRPGSALVGGLLMGALALPFARAVWTSAGRGSVGVARLHRAAVGLHQDARGDAVGHDGVEPPGSPVGRADPRAELVAAERSAAQRLEHGAEAGLALRVVVGGRGRVPAARRDPASGVVGLDRRRPRARAATCRSHRDRWRRAPAGRRHRLRHHAQELRRSSPWLPGSSRGRRQESPSASGLSAYSSDGSGCVAASGRSPDGAVIVGSASWSPCA